MGMPEADIATVVGISPKTLRKYYRVELDTGHLQANAKVAQALYNKALSKTDKSAVTAQIFWLKTRAGWRETPTAHEIAGKDGGPIEHSVIEMIVVDPKA
jgi:hypothetical protein